MDTNYDRTGILGKISVFFLLLYPFTSSIYPAISFGILKSTYTFIIAIILFFAIIIRKKNFTITSDYLTVCIWFLCAIFSMIIGGNQSYIGLLQYSAIFISILVLTSSFDWTSFAMHLIEGVGIFYSLTVWMEFLFYDQFDLLARQFILSSYYDSAEQLGSWGFLCGLTTQVAIVSCYIVMALFMNVIRIIAGRKCNSRTSILNCFEIILLVGALLLTGKRAHLVFAVMSIFVILYMMNRDASFRIKFLLLSGIFAGVAYLFLNSLIETSDSLFLHTINRIFNITDYNDALNGRNGYYEIAKILINEHPILGVGWEGFKEYTSTGMNGHNVYLQLLVDMGLPLGIVMIAIMAINWIKSFRILSSIYQGSNYNYKEICLGGFSFLYQTFFMLYSFTGNPIYDTEYIAVYGMSICFMILIRRYNLSLCST